jgi:hypothetical protein
MVTGVSVHTQGNTDMCVHGFVHMHVFPSSVSWRQEVAVSIPHDETWVPNTLLQFREPVFSRETVDSRTEAESMNPGSIASTKVLEGEKTVKNTGTSPKGPSGQHYKFLFCVCGTWIWTQGFTFARQVLYCFEPPAQCYNNLHEKLQLH